MKFKIAPLIYLFGVFVAGFFLLQNPHELTALAANTSQEEVTKLQNYDVIYLGENHARAEHHATQLEIITQLSQSKTRSNTQLAVALEMFQIPFQPSLDRYLNGKISEADLREQTEYDTRWGFDWELYAPILRFSRENGISLIALNTPEEITQKVAKTGLDSLEGSDFRYIPDKVDLDLDNREYRQKIAEIYRSHLASENGNSINEDNFFAAQILWDETMADRISHYHREHPKSQIVVLVGKAHVANGYALPDRVTRRIENKSFTQTVILLSQ